MKVIRGLLVAVLVCSLFQFSLFLNSTSIYSQADPCWPAGCENEADLVDEDKYTDDDYDYDSAENPINKPVIKEKPKPEIEPEKKAIKPLVKPGKRIIASAGRLSRLSLSATYLSSMGSLAATLPSGMAGFLAYDQSPSLFGLPSSGLMPSLRIEPGFLVYQNGDRSLMGPSATAGPIWFFGLTKNHFVEVALQGGVSILTIKAGEFSTNSTTFTSQAIVGYSFNPGRLSFFIHSRFSYLHDQVDPLMNIGGQAGVGVTF